MTQQRVPLPDKQYLREPGAGRPPKAARQIFEGIVHVRCQWEALPAEHTRCLRASRAHPRRHRFTVHDQTETGVHDR